METGGRGADEACRGCWTRSRLPGKSATRRGGGARIRSFAQKSASVSEGRRHVLHFRISRVVLLFVSKDDQKQIVRSGADYARSLPTRPRPTAAAPSRAAATHLAAGELARVVSKTCTTRLTILFYVQVLDPLPSLYCWCRYRLESSGRRK